MHLLDFHKIIDTYNKFIFNNSKISFDSSKHSLPKWYFEYPNIFPIRHAPIQIYRGGGFPDIILNEHFSSIVNKTKLNSINRNISKIIYIVTPSLNSELYIDSTILSVFSQEGDFSIRYHIQDGGSTDTTLQRLESWKTMLNSSQARSIVRCKELIFSYASSPDNGMYEAIHNSFLSLGIPGNAVTTWINSDDTLMPGSIASVFEIFKLQHDVSWVIGAVNGSGEYNQEKSYRQLLYPVELISNGLCDGKYWNFIQQEGSFWLNSLYNRVGGLNLKLLLAGDWDLWRRFAKETKPVQVLWPLGRFRIHGKQLSSSIKKYRNEIDMIVPNKVREASYQRLRQRALDDLNVVKRPYANSVYKIDTSSLNVDYLHPENSTMNNFINASLDNLIIKKNIEQNTICKVLTFCTLEKGGAAIGSKRRIAALRKLGADVRLATLFRQSEHDYVDLIEPALDGIDTSKQINVWWSIAKSCIFKVRTCVAYEDYELFSLPITSLDWRSLKSYIDEFDLLHLHWVVGMLDYDHLRNVLKDKPVVWTLADFNAFSGGCHYPNGCQEYENECRSCPQLGGINPLTSQVLNFKKESYKGLNLHFICPSQWIADKARKSSIIGDFPIHVISNAYPVDIFKPYDKQSARQQLGLPIDATLVLFGADSVDNKRKGGEVLRHAVHLYLSQSGHHPIEAVLFGRSNLELPITSHSMGHLPQESLPLLYSAVDLFISTSKEDVGPMTVGEALLCGTPVVGFPIGILPEIVSHMVTGYIAKYCDVIDFATGIAWAVNAVAQDPNLGDRCRQIALEFCDPDRCAREHLKLYQSLMSRRDCISKAFKKVHRQTDLPPTSNSSIPAAVSVHENVSSKPFRFLGRKDMDYFTYSRWSHWDLLEESSKKLYNTTIDPQTAVLKRYQDSLIFAFITEQIPPGSKILEVGGGRSRILQAFRDCHECWNLDKLEGLGNGPKDLGDVPYKLVRSYIGEFSPDLPANYFDFVFSISALEHVPREEELYSKVVKDIDRILAPGGFSLHLLDFVVDEKGVRMHPLIAHLFQNVKTLNTFTDFEKVRHDQDLYMMTEASYKAVWERITKRSYQDFGKPANISILWQKPARKPMLSIVGNDFVSICDSSGSSIPIFNVVTTCFNNVESVEETIRSVTSQTGAFKLRYNLVDRGSTDGTLRLLQNFASNFHKNAFKTYCNNVDFSFYAADFSEVYDSIRNGFDNMSIASHDFMAWVNPGDKLMPYTLNTLANIIQKHSNIQWIGIPQYSFHKKSTIFEHGHQIYDSSLKILINFCEEMQLSRFCDNIIFFKYPLWFKSKHLLDDKNLNCDLVLWSEMAKHAQCYQCQV